VEDLAAWACSAQINQEDQMAHASNHSEGDLFPIKSALRQLTANLMRVSRGSGKPGEIGNQLGALSDALQKHHAMGHGLASGTLGNMLIFDVWLKTVLRTVWLSKRLMRK
jgi:hypothetical protein